MSVTKKMHFVPETYMRKFASKIGNDYKIHLLRRENFLEPVGKPVVLRNICAENYLYSIAKPGQNNDAAVEEYFAKVFDAEYNRIFESITSDSFKDLSNFDLYSVIAWVSSMFLRNRQIKYFLLNNFEEAFTLGYKQAVKDGKNVFNYRRHEIVIGERSFEELRASILPWDKPFLNSIIIPHIAETTWKRLGDSIISLVTLKTDAEFITSDNPVTTEWSRDDNGVLNGGHVRCIPLSSKHLLKLSPNHESKNPLMLHRVDVSHECEQSYALARNQIQLKLCSHFILGNQNSLGRFQEKMKPILKEVYG